MAELRGIARRDTRRAIALSPLEAATVQGLGTRAALGAADRDQDAGKRSVKPKEISVIYSTPLTEQQAGAQARTSTSCYQQSP